MPNQKVRSTAALITMMFGSMAASAQNARIEKMITAQKENNYVEPPHSFYKNRGKAGGKSKPGVNFFKSTTYHPSQTGKRQAERIAKQIARGQLKASNGLVTKTEPQK